MIAFLACETCLLDRASRFLYSNWLLLAVGGTIFLGGMLAMLWAFRSGQFKNVETIKERMLEDFKP